MKQKFFNFNFKKNYSKFDFYVSKSNYEAYNSLINNNILKHIILKGPLKSGKTHLALIWKDKNHAVDFSSNNYEKLINQNKNIFLDNINSNINEEQLFHLINHCFNNNLKILITTNQNINNIKLKLNDLISRLNSFHLLEIKNPDDDLINNLLIKLLYDKQIKITNDDIFSYIIKRINRSYNDIYQFVEKIDKLSLEKKRELTIPLIRELM